MSDRPFLGKNFEPLISFLKTYSPYSQRLEPVKISHPRTPLGSQDHYLGVRPPNQRDCFSGHILQGKFFYLLADHVRHYATFTQVQKKWIRPFFGPFLTQKRPKKGKSKKGKSFLPPDGFLIGLRFPNDSTFFSNH